jgi:hypothetical protein
MKSRNRNSKSFNARNEAPKSSKQVFQQFGKWVCKEKKVKKIALPLPNGDMPFTLTQLKSSVQVFTAEELKLIPLYHRDLGWYVEVPEKTRPATAKEIESALKAKAKKEKDEAAALERKKKAQQKDLVRSINRCKSAIKHYEMRIRQEQKEMEGYAKRLTPLVEVETIKLSAEQVEFFNK